MGQLLRALALVLALALEPRHRQARACTWPHARATNRSGCGTSRRRRASPTSYVVGRVAPRAWHLGWQLADTRGVPSWLAAGGARKLGAQRGVASQWQVRGECQRGQVPPRVGGVDGWVCPEAVGRTPALHHGTCGPQKPAGRGNGRRGQPAAGVGLQVMVLASVSRAVLVQRVGCAAVGLDKWLWEHRNKLKSCVNSVYFNYVLCTCTHTRHAARCDNRLALLHGAFQHSGEERRGGSALG